MSCSTQSSERQPKETKKKEHIMALLPKKIATFEHLEEEFVSSVTFECGSSFRFMVTGKKAIKWFQYRIDEQMHTYAIYLIIIPFGCNRQVKAYIFESSLIRRPIPDTATTADVCISLSKDPSKRCGDNYSSCMDKSSHCKSYSQGTCFDQDVNKPSLCKCYSQDTCFDQDVSKSFHCESYSKESCFDQDVSKSFHCESYSKEACFEQDVSKSFHCESYSKEACFDQDVSKSFHCKSYSKKACFDQDVGAKDGVLVNGPPIIRADEDDAEPLINPVPYSSIDSSANDISPSSMDSDTPQDSHATNKGPPQSSSAHNGSAGDGGRGNDRDGSGADGRGGGNGSGDGRPPPWNRTTGSPGHESELPNSDDEDKEEELDCADDAKTEPENQKDTNCTEEIQGHGINENSDSSQSSTKYETMPRFSDDFIPQVEPCDDPPPSGDSPISTSNSDAVPEINLNFIILLRCFRSTQLGARRYCQLFLRSLCFLLWIYLLTARTRLPCDTHRPHSVLRRRQPVCRRREAFGFLMSQRIRRYLEDGHRSQLLGKKIQKRRKGPRRLRLHVSSARSRQRGWAAPERNPSSTSVSCDWHETTGIQCFDDILSGRGTSFPNPRPGNIEEPVAQDNDDGIENRFPLPVMRPPGSRLRRNISLWAVCEEDVEEQNENQILQDNEEDVRDFSLRPEMQLRHGRVLIEDDELDWQNEGEFDDMGENMVFSLERRLQLQQRLGDIILGAEGTAQDTQFPPTDQQGLENSHDHSVSQGERNQPGENAEGAVGGEAGGGPDKDKCVRCLAPVPKERVHLCGRAYYHDCTRALSAPPSVPSQSGCPHCG